MAVWHAEDKIGVATSNLERCGGPRIFDQTTIAMANLTTAQTVTDSDCSLAAVNVPIVIKAPVRRLTDPLHAPLAHAVSQT